MELDQVLEKRRSIRKYAKGDKVSPELVKKFVSAALEAPSWKNFSVLKTYRLLWCPHS